MNLPYGRRVIIRIREKNGDPEGTPCGRITRHVDEQMRGADFTSISIWKFEDASKGEVP